jgi:hypothetical protein
MYKTVQITCFTKVLYVTACGFVGCILFLEQTALHRSRPIQEVADPEPRCASFITNGLLRLLGSGMEAGAEELADVSMFRVNSVRSFRHWVLVRVCADAERCFSTCRTWSFCFI